MKGFEGNKTLLPLSPGKSPFEGKHPIIHQVLKSLPPGPKAIVVNHRENDIISSTKSFNAGYFRQPQLNGTGGALIAAKSFIENMNYDRLIITMGDVPLVMPETFHGLLSALADTPLVVLGFTPDDKRSYGLLEISEGLVRGIIEWKYWKDFSIERQSRLKICNSGIYAVRKDSLIKYINVLARRPHIVSKERNGQMINIEEFFITDLIEIMHEDGLAVGYTIVEDENEVMGVDDLASLKRAQEIFGKRR